MKDFFKTVLAVICGFVILQVIGVFFLMTIIIVAVVAVLMNTRTVLPQSTFGMVLTFDYTINTTYSQNNPIHSVSESATASINLYNDFRIYTWDMNTRITYTIVINPKTNKITFDPCLAESWNNDPDNSMYIE